MFTVVKSANAKAECQAIMDRIRTEDPSYWPYGLDVDNHDGGVYMIRKASTNEAIGFTGWQERMEGMKKVGYYTIGILPEYRNNGFAKAAVSKLIAIKSASVDCVRAFIMPHNTASLGLAAALEIPVVKVASSLTNNLLKVLGGLGTAGGMDYIMHDGDYSHVSPGRIGNFALNSAIGTGAMHNIGKGDLETAAGLVGSIPMKDVAMKSLDMSPKIEAALTASTEAARRIPETPAPSFSGKEKMMLAAALGIGGLGLGAAGLYGARALNNLSNSTHKGRVSVRLPTRNPNDQETTVELPIDDIQMSKTLYQALGRDTRRKLHSESKERVRSRKLEDPDEESEKSAAITASMAKPPQSPKPIQPMAFQTTVNPQAAAAGAPSSSTLPGMDAAMQQQQVTQLQDQSMQHQQAAQQAQQDSQQAQLEKQQAQNQMKMQQEQAKAQQAQLQHQMKLQEQAMKQQTELQKQQAEQGSQVNNAMFSALQAKIENTTKSLTKLASRDPALLTRYIRYVKNAAATGWKPSTPAAGSANEAAHYTPNAWNNFAFSKNTWGDSLYNKFAPKPAPAGQQPTLRSFAQNLGAGLAANVGHAGEFLIGSPMRYAARSFSRAGSRAADAMGQIRQKGFDAPTSAYGELLGAGWDGLKGLGGAAMGALGFTGGGMLAKPLTRLGFGALKGLSRLGMRGAAGGVKAMPRVLWGGAKMMPTAGKGMLLAGIPAAMYGMATEGGETSPAQGATGGTTATPAGDGDTGGNWLEKQLKLLDQFPQDGSSPAVPTAPAGKAPAAMTAAINSSGVDGAMNALNRYSPPENPGFARSPFEQHADHGNKWVNALYPLLNKPRPQQDFNALAPGVQMSGGMPSQQLVAPSNLLALVPQLGLI